MVEGLAESFADAGFGLAHAVLAHPESLGDDLGGTVKAVQELGIGGAPAAPPLPAPAAVTPHAAAGDPVLSWGPDAEKELKKIPFFVRGKARRNTERYAAERGIATITLETLYDAKAHFSR